MDYPTLLHLEHEHLAGRCDLQTVLDQSDAYLAGRELIGDFGEPLVTLNWKPWKIGPMHWSTSTTDQITN